MDGHDSWNGINWDSTAELAQRSRHVRAEHGYTEEQHKVAIDLGTEREKIKRSRAFGSLC